MSRRVMAPGGVWEKSVKKRRVKRRRLWLLTLSGAIACQELTAQPLRFTRETIQVTVADRFCILDGSYQFENRGPESMQQVMFYPFSEPSEAVDSIRVTDVSRQTELPIVQRPAGVAFGIEIPPYSTRVYSVRYRQSTPGRRFEYILTTTHRWKHPIERAVFRVLLPDTLAVTGISFQPDSTKSVEGAALLVVERREFLPDRNLIMQWKRRSP
jgi:hypothetical protein